MKIMSMHTENTISALENASMDAFADIIDRLRGSTLNAKQLEQLSQHLPGGGFPTFDDDLLTALSGYTESSDKSVGYWAVVCLGDAGGPAEVRVLSQTLERNTGSAEIARACLESIKNIGGAEARRVLRSLTKNNSFDADIRLAASQALSDLHTGGLTDPLEGQPVERIPSLEMKQDFSHAHLWDIVCYNGGVTPTEIGNQSDEARELFARWELELSNN